MKKTFGFLRSLVILAGLFVGCGGDGDSSGLADVIPGVGSGGSDNVMVGLISPTLLSPTGTCTIPSAAESWITLPKPMRYAVDTSNVLWCTQGIPAAGRANNIDFSAPSMKGLTCLELVSNVSLVKEVTVGLINDAAACCSLVVPDIASVNGQSVDTGYVQSEGIGCAPAANLQVTALCSISGVFMGWACGVAGGNQSGSPGSLMGISLMGILPLKKS